MEPYASAISWICPTFSALQPVTTLIDYTALLMANG